MILKSDAKFDEKLTWKMIKEFDKFSPEHLKKSKLELWWDLFAQSWKYMTFTETLCVMTMKNDTKTEDPADIHLDEDVLKTSFVFVFRRRLQDVFKTSWSRPIYSSWPYVFKTSLRCLQDIFKTSCKDIFKMFSRRTTRLNCLTRSHLWEIYGQRRKC